MLMSTTTTFAYVSWFDELVYDSQAKLHYIFSDSLCESALPLTAISSPLATALDEQEPNKVWILN